MAAEISSQMTSFKDAGAQASLAEEASAKSAAEAKTAPEQAAAVRADLQSKQSKLQVDMAIVKSQYEALTPNQREALAALPPAPPPAPHPAPLPPGDPAILAMAPPGIAPPPAGAVVPPPGIPPGDMAPPQLGGGHSPTV